MARHAGAEADAERPAGLPERRLLRPEAVAAAAERQADAARLDIEIAQQARQALHRVLGLFGSEGRDIPRDDTVTRRLQTRRDLGKRARRQAVRDIGSVVQQGAERAKGGEQIGLGDDRLQRRDVGGRRQSTRSEIRHGGRSFAVERRRIADEAFMEARKIPRRVGGHEQHEIGAVRDLAERRGDPAAGARDRRIGEQPRRVAVIDRAAGPVGQRQQRPDAVEIGCQTMK